MSTPPRRQLIANRLPEAELVSFAPNGLTPGQSLGATGSSFVPGAVAGGTAARIAVFAAGAERDAESIGTTHDQIFTPL